MKHDLANEWHLFKKNGSVDLKITKARLPYMVQIIDKLKIEEVMFLAQVKNNPTSYSITIDDSVINLSRVDQWQLCREANSDINLDKLFQLSVAQEELENIEELMFVIKYNVSL